MGRARAILCLSHLRWNFVFQRPQHVLSRFARSRPVYFVEEPEYGDSPTPHYTEEITPHGVVVLRPQLPHMDRAAAESVQRRMLREYLAIERIESPILWYYTPMALGYTDDLKFETCVYDCMDELSMFAYAPPELREREQELFARADVVFTGGRSLYYNKRRHHHNVHCFPSAVDGEHFAPRFAPDPDDMRGLPRPRFGFYGVVDERFDVDYLDEIARLRPQWQFIIVGPLVKIDAGQLPRRENVLYVPQRSYEELPAYLQHWDVAMLPFALNDSTRFISPTKTLEYLAAHKPVISTPIADVVDPYGERGLVAIAPQPGDFVRAAERILRDGVDEHWHSDVDKLIAEMSWEKTVQAMSAELARVARTSAVAR